MGQDRNASTQSTLKRRARRRARRGRQSPFAELRNSFLTGVVVVTPITVTAWLVYTFVTFVDARVKPLIPAIYNPESYLPFAIPGLGLVFAIVFLTMLGALAANIAGRSLLGFGESVVERVPLVRNIYGALKQLVTTVASPDSESFDEVVLVEYPRPGLFAVGFVSADAQGAIRAALGEGWVGVFVPTTPNPTGGFLLYAREDELKPLDISPEEGAKLILSAGLVVPEVNGTGDLFSTRPKQSDRSVAVEQVE